MLVLKLHEDDLKTIKTLHTGDMVHLTMILDIFFIKGTDLKWDKGEGNGKGIKYCTFIISHRLTS